MVTASHESIKAAFARLYSDAMTRPRQPVPAAIETGVVDLAVRRRGRGQRATDNYGYEYKGADVIVQKLLALAIEQRCSDMHIETLSNRIGIRFRIDGLLQAPQLGEIEAACNQPRPRDGVALQDSREAGHRRAPPPAGRQLPRACHATASS